MDIYESLYSLEIRLKQEKWPCHMAISLPHS